MKKIFTLAAASALSAAALNTQAQTLDGLVQPSEGYTRIAQYTSTVRGFGDHGLAALYAKTTPTKVYIALVGALEGNGNSFQVFLNIPGKTGVAAGTALPASNITGTSFEKNQAKLEMEVDYGFGVKGGATAASSSIIDYTRVTGSGANATATDQATGDLLIAGTAATVPAATTGGLNKTRMAFLNVFTLVGPVATTPTHNGTQGWEIELDKADLGITDGAVLQLFAAQNGGDGGYYSSDVLPEVTGNAAVPTAPDSDPRKAGNFGTNPDFATLAGTQRVDYTATAVLSNRSQAASALKFSVHPNPSSSLAQIEYTVAGKQDVALDVFNTLGQRVQAFTTGKQAGFQQYSLRNLAAGTYLVKLRVGDQATSQKLIVE